MTVSNSTDVWRKASYSSEQTNCVETAVDPNTASVRDTKAREQGKLDVSSDAWRSLIERL